MSGSPPPQWKWNGRSLAFATVQRPADQEVTDRLRVLPRLLPVVAPPAIEGRRGFRRTRIADVEARSVGDDRLVRDAVRIGGRVGRLGLHPRDEVVERPVPMLEDPGLESCHAVDRDADGGGELVRGDRRLWEALVREDRDDPGRIEEPLRVGDRVGLERLLPRGRDGLARGLAPEMCREPAAHGEREDGRVREAVRDAPQVVMDSGGRVERLAQEHHPGVEALGFLRQEIAEAVRVRVRIDDLDMRRSTFVISSSDPQYRHRCARTTSSGSWPSKTSRSARLVARNESNSTSPIASRSIDDFSSSPIASPSDVGS